MKSIVSKMYKKREQLEHQKLELQVNWSSFQNTVNHRSVGVWIMASNGHTVTTNNTPATNQNSGTNHANFTFQRVGISILGSIDFINVFGSLIYINDHSIRDTKNCSVWFTNTCYWYYKLRWVININIKYYSTIYRTTIILNVHQGITQWHTTTNKNFSKQTDRQFITWWWFCIFCYYIWYWCLWSKKI